MSCNVFLGCLEIKKEDMPKLRKVFRGDYNKKILDNIEEDLEK